MNHEKIIKNLFTSEYGYNEKIAALEDLQKKDPELLDNLIKQYQPLFYSESCVHTMSPWTLHCSYEVHTMSFSLIAALNKYRKDSRYHPSLDMTLNPELFNKHYTITK